MAIPIDKQISFFDWQVQEHEMQWLKYLNTQMKYLFEEREAHIGRIWGFDEKRGNIIIRIKKGFAPRLNYPLQAFTFDNKALANGGPFSWDFTYRHFRENYTHKSSEATPVFYLKAENQEWSYIGCNSVSIEFLDKIFPFLKEKVLIPVVLAATDPPIEYLVNLKNYSIRYPQDELINIDFKKNIESWKPINVDTTAKAKKIVFRELKEKQNIMIQGPPGTGKSYLIAEVTANYLESGKSVCITALTNKALVEVAEKPGLISHIEKGLVYKTRLSADERKNIPGLKDADSLNCGKGSLLLTTYYKLSDWFNPMNFAEKKKNKYDILIIEEASQAFLSTISAFKRLSGKMILVGDPMQLSPIVLNENEGKRIHPQILSFSRGLESVAANYSLPSYRLTITRRLTNAAAKLTGIFYENSLVSDQIDPPILSANEEARKYLPIEGGTLIKYLDIAKYGNTSEVSANYIRKLVRVITDSNKHIRVAVLTHQRKTVKYLQDKLSDFQYEGKKVVIETIDRVQGLTVDYTILLLPLQHGSIEYDLNRFNVATSRSKTVTLLITDRHIHRLKSIDRRVKKYLEECVVFE